MEDPTYYLPYLRKVAAGRPITTSTAKWLEQLGYITATKDGKKVTPTGLTPEGLTILNPPKGH